MDLKKLKKKVYISLIIGVGIFAGLSVFSDIDKLVKVFITFDFRYLPIILILAPLNYCFRFIKWNYYLNQIKIKVRMRDNILIFASGLSMTVTPGKIGELLKSYLLKEINNVPISKTAPLVMAERLTDGISLLILASFGVLSYNYGKGIVLFVLICILAFIIIVQSPRVVHRIIGVISRLGFVKKFAEGIQNFYDSTYILFKIKPLLFAVSIGVISWFFEGLVIFLTLKAMDTEISLLASIFIVSFSSIVGAISMLPGGLFAAEGSIVGLLLFMGITKDIATATTIITRFSTLWLGVFIGMIALMLIQKRLFDKDSFNDGI